MTEKINYLPETRLDSREVKKIGVAVFVIELETGQIWTVRERNSSGVTGKNTGDLSLPMETRKKGESVMSNTVGAMEEFPVTGDGDKLVWIDGVSYKGRYPLVPGVLVDVIVVGFRGRGITWGKNGFCDDEVYCGGWKEAALLTGESNLRSGVNNCLELCEKNNWISDFLNEMNGLRVKRTIGGEKIRRYLAFRKRMGDYGEDGSN